MTTPPPDYERLKHLARNGTAAERRALAQRRDLPPEMLYYLARDAEAAVRAAAAANPASPAKADGLLAGDTVEEVRAAVGRKLAEHWRQGAPEISRDTLMTLSRDDVLRVRAAIADAIKTCVDAPHALIASLARDTELLVAQPVLEFSPVLTERDLIDIIATGAADGALSAIARRKDLASGVTEALVETGSVPAIAQLLRNSTAQIREDTLDRLIDRSRGVTSWQEALVERDGMSKRATLKLATVLADHLLSRLVQRHTVNADIATELHRVVQHRVEQIVALAPQEGGSPSGFEARIAQIRAQYPEGDVDATAVLAAMVAGDRAFIVAALHVATGLGLPVVVDVLGSHSAKAICALCWKAGLEPQVAVEVQARIGHLGEREIIRPTPTGGYALSGAAMEWQIELFEAAHNVQDTGPESRSNAR